MASAGFEWAAWRVWKKIETTAMRSETAPEAMNIHGLRPIRYEKPSSHLSIMNHDSGTANMNDTRRGAQNFVRSKDRTSFVVLPIMRRTPISFLRCLMKNSDIPMNPRMEMRTATPVNMLTILIVSFSSSIDAFIVASTLCTFQSRSSEVPSTSLTRSQSFCHASGEPSVLTIKLGSSISSVSLTEMRNGW